jgi:hypothetical protein
MSTLTPTFPGKPQRRWLQSAIAAANEEVVMLPWAAKRLNRPMGAAAKADSIRIFPSGSTNFTAIAAK